MLLLTKVTVGKWGLHNMAKYLYNGIELPELPEWDKTTYPYATIINCSNTETHGFTVGLLVSNYPPVLCGEGKMARDSIEGASLLYAYNADADTWGEPTDWGLSYSYYGSKSGLEPVWSNTDVLYSTVSSSVADDLKGTLYLPASDPVPVTPINADAYIVKGGKLYKVKGGASGSVQNIMTFDSVDEMNATSAPEGTIALVPSEGESGGGLSVVELTTIPTDEGSALTEEENAVMTKAFAKGLSIIVKFDPNIGITATASYPFAYLFVEGMSSGFSCVLGGYTYNITTGDGSTWVFSRTSNQEET